jgi:hypothetical protein
MVGDHVHLHRHARPDRQVRARVDGRRDPFVGPDQVAGVQRDAKARQRMVHRRLHLAARHAGAHQAAPEVHRLEIGTDEGVEIVARGVWQVFRPFGKPARAADVGPPMADVERQHPPAFDPLPSGTGQAQGACAGGEGDVTAQWKPADAGGLDHFEVGPSLAQREGHAPHGRCRHVVRELEPRDVVGRHDTAQTGAGMHEKRRPVHHLVREGAQEVGQNRRDLERVLGVAHFLGGPVFPAHRADAPAASATRGRAAPRSGRCRGVATEARTTRNAPRRYRPPQPPARTACRAGIRSRPEAAVRHRAGSASAPLRSAGRTRWPTGDWPRVPGRRR